MQCILIFLSLFIFYSSSVLGDNQEALVIPLATESPLAPIAFYLQKSPHSDAQYDSHLKEILRFDLTYSGRVQPLEVHVDAESETDPSKIWAVWKSYSAHYGLYIQTDNNQLRPRIYDVSKRKILALNPLPLTGNLEQDRRVVHQLIHQVIKQLFQAPAITLGKITYTLDANALAPYKRTQVWQADYDGANAKMLFEHPSLLVTPCRVPLYDSTPLAFVSYKLGQPKIMLSTWGGQCRRLSALGGSQLAPCFDPKGNYICFVCDVEGNPDIYLMKINHSEEKAQKAQKIFSSKRGTQASPSFNPEGTKLALVSSKDGSPRIYLIDVEKYLKGEDADKAQLISRKNRENTSPVWSPDGRYIAYSARSAGSRQIWIYDTTLRTEICLTQGTGSHENPCWTPDSLHLYYNVEESQGSHLYMIDLVLQQPVRITKHPGSARFAVFS